YFSAYDPPVLTPILMSEQWHDWPVWFWNTLLALAKGSTASWPQAIYQLRREHGIGDRGNPIFEGQFSPDLNLALFSPQIAPPQRYWPLNTPATGFIFYDKMKLDEEALPLGIQEFLRAGEPPIVFTLGSSVVNTSTDFYETSLQAAQALNRRAILVAGD